MREKSIRLFENAIKNHPIYENEFGRELKTIQANCRHNGNWVYSPDKEKRICGNCCTQQRKGHFDTEQYFSSVWIAPPEETDRNDLRKIFTKWENKNLIKL